MSAAARIILCYAIGAACCGLTVFLGYYVQREAFGALLTAYALFFGLYLGVVSWQTNLTEAEADWYTGLGIVLRILLLFSLPNLSDDFYRFLWDGHLTVAGIHPFAHPPAYFMEQPMDIPGITPELFALLNSPNYYTVYPPVCQAIFALAVWVAPQGLWGGVLVIKLFLLAGEIGTLCLLRSANGLLRTKERRKAVLLYALNPLLILEIVGNCHFEGLVIFLLLAGGRMLQCQRLPAAAALWGLATATKLLPPLFLPLVWRWLGWRQGWWFNMWFATACGLLFLPWLNVALLMNMLQSIGLYFQKFEFNGSVYYLAQMAHDWWRGFQYVQAVGPGLALGTLTGVLWIARRTATRDTARAGRWTLPEAMLWAVFLYLSCATTVHPWYATVPLALGILTPWRFPIVWSGLIVLSYSHYGGGRSSENFWLIGLEYGLLWLFIVGEVRARKRQAPF